MRITSFFVASAFICTASAANADTIEFSYQGQDFICTEHEPYSYCGPFGNTTSGWQGSITIDTDLYPLESVAGTTLRLTYDIGQETEFEPSYLRVFSTTVTSGSAKDVRTLVLSDRGGPRSGEVWDSDPLFEFVEIEGVFKNTIDYLVAPSPSFIEITINDDLSVTEWAFSSGLQGGSWDYSSSHRGDNFNNGYVSVGPGSWSVLVNGAPPVSNDDPPVSDGAPPVSPVPLPASALLLLAGLGGLAAFRKRGSSA